MDRQTAIDLYLNQHVLREHIAAIDSAKHRFSLTAGVLELRLTDHADPRAEHGANTAA